VRGDAGTDDEGKELPGPISCVSGKSLWLQIEPPFGALDHGLGRGHLVEGPRRRGFNIDNDRVLDVNEVVEPISELHALVRFRRPRRRGIGRRDHFRRLAIGFWGRLAGRAATAAIPSFLGLRLDLGVESSKILALSGFIVTVERCRVLPKNDASRDVIMKCAQVLSERRGGAAQVFGTGFRET
jgi:hypothetical protein